jgi:hypothetical protein
MSSDIHKPIASFDISIIRSVLRHAGFRYEQPMCELDRGAARYALGLYQNGVRQPGRLISAITHWADEAVQTRADSGVNSASGSVRS